MLHGPVDSKFTLEEEINRQTKKLAELKDFFLQKLPQPKDHKAFFHSKVVKTGPSYFMGAAAIDDCPDLKIYVLDSPKPKPDDKKAQLYRPSLAVQKAKARIKGEKSPVVTFDSLLKVEFARNKPLIRDLDASTMTQNPDKEKQVKCAVSIINRIEYLLKEAPSTPRDSNTEANWQKFSEKMDLYLSVLGRAKKSLQKTVTIDAVPVGALKN